MELAPLHTIFQLFSWFAKQAKTQGTIFSQKGEELKKTKESEQILNILVGERKETVAIAKPEGGEGPPVAMQLAEGWMIGELGHLSGRFTVVGQVDQVLFPGQEFPTMRIARGAPATNVELKALREMVQHFIEPSKAFEIAVSEDDISIIGPALWLTPITIFR